MPVPRSTGDEVDAVAGHDRGIGFRLRVEYPVVQPITVIPHAVLYAHVRPGDESVQ
jgi:hypothetical protein